MRLRWDGIIARLSYRFNFLAIRGEKLMPVWMFRSEEGWVQVDYGTGKIPITRSKYEENKYKPDFDKLPSEAEYWAAEKKNEDDAKGT
jgi:hypothetical protein